eukprot:jgi/Bigna1/83049/fgenesh1_pg.101_\
MSSNGYSNSSPSRVARATYETCHAFVVLVSLVVVIWRIAKRGSNNFSPSQRILWGSVGMLLSIVALSLLITFGGPWQLFEVFASILLALINTILVYITKNITKASYTASRMIKNVPRQIDLIFDAVLVLTLLTAIASMAGVLLTNQLRFVSIRLIGVGLLGSFLVPYQTFMSCQLSRIVTIHITSLNSYADSSEVKSAPVPQNPVISNAAVEKDGFFPNYEEERLPSTSPIGNTRENMAKERQNQWVQKLLGVRRRLLLFTSVFDTVGVVGIIAILMAGFQNLQSDKRFSEDVDDLFRDEESFPQFVPIVAQTASLLLSIAFIVHGGSPWCANEQHGDMK